MSTNKNLDLQSIVSRVLSEMKEECQKEGTEFPLVRINLAEFQRTRMLQEAQEGLFFMKMQELREKFSGCKDSASEDRVIAALAKPSLLIIDEVGRCRFSLEETRMFFNLVDRRYQKDEQSIAFTSNRQPSEWREFFTDDETLICSLDRITDDAIIVTMKGETYRGQNKQIINLTVKDPVR